MSDSWEMVGRETTFAALLEQLRQVPGIEVLDQHLVQRVLLDTFDWRIHGQGLVLELERSAAADTLLARDRAGAVRARQPVERVPVFAGDLPPGPVRELVAGAIEMRALLPQVDVDSTRVRVAERNEDDKIVARATLERLRIDGRELDPRITVEPVRGYHREARALRSDLQAQLAVDPAEPGQGIAALFAAGGAVPGSYSGKFKVALDADAPPSVSMARLLLDLLDTMERNEEGVREDIDTEFLHDFRVAIRRTRSLLPVARRCFHDTEALDGFIAEFRSFVQPTGVVRDLDVFLLGFDDLAAGVATEWRDDLRALEPLIATERARAQRLLVEALRSPWPDLERRWRAYLEAEAAHHGGPRGPGESGELTTDAFARQAVADALRVVRKHGRRLTDHSPPEDIHRVRKKAKALRYVLEAFASQLPAEHLAPATKELKKFQDVLGRYQDRDVQVHTIREYTELVHRQGDHDTDVLLAMGALRAHVRDDAERERVRCMKAFRRFDSKANHARYDALVAAPTRRPSSGSASSADRTPTSAAASCAAEPEGPR